MLETAGSSPLTRGAREHVSRRIRTSRLIPAHAGSTPLPAKKCDSSAAHPRSRGEHHGVSLELKFPTGSSPLTRGARMNLVAPPWAERLIPAHAGSTYSSFSTHRATSAHPRSRGEHPATLPTTRPTTRLIPAHAGSTRGGSFGREFGQAHPRSRGEHSGQLIRQWLPDGSSPLTRGAPGRRASYCAVAGLIPAHAGSTRFREFS